MEQTLKTPMLIAGEAGYNAWPMLQAVGKTLVCAYSRGLSHSTTEHARATYVRISDDRGASWSQEQTLVDCRDSSDMVEAKGLDADGRLLLWVKHSKTENTHDDSCTHSLHRSPDGRSFVQVLNWRPNPMPVQIMSLVNLPGRTLLAFWFSGGYDRHSPKTWGTLISHDNGVSWSQRTVFQTQCKEEWPTETSGVYLGNGRILAIARTEGPGGALFQLESGDGGDTWSCLRTSVDDVLESTPCLFHEPRNGVLRLYYYQRGKGLLKGRTAPVAEVWDHPDCWSRPVCVAQGGLSYHSGNVNGTALADGYYLAYYDGQERQTDIYMVKDRVP